MDARCTPDILYVEQTDRRSADVATSALKRRLLEGEELEKGGVNVLNYSMEY